MEKEVSCINSRAVLDYVAEYYPGDHSFFLRGLDPEIDSCPDPEKFLRDPNNWISCKIASELYRRASELFQDDEVAYKIAKHSVERTNLGYAQRIIVKAFGSYERALRNLQRINDKWARNKRVEVLEIGRNEARVRLHWDNNMAVSKHLCLMNRGAYTFLPLIWGGKPLKLQEVCCQFEGAPYCEYSLSWIPRNKFHEVLSRFFTLKSVLMETVKEMEDDKKIIEMKYEEVSRLNTELNRKIKQITAMQETGKAILSVLDIEELLGVIMNLLSSVCQINRCIIMLVNEQSASLEYIHGIGFDQQTLEAIKDYRVPLHRVSNMLARVASTGRSEYIPEVKESSLKKDNILLREGRPVSAFVVPLITRSKVIGVMATDGIGQKGIPSETREILEIFAPQIAIAIENARLYRSLQDKMEELKHSQTLLSRTEKFSFLGNLAARLAHEIKNPMTAIGTFIQLLPYKYDDAEFREDFYKVAMEETTRVNNLINELLDLVRPKESNFAYGDLHDLIEKMVLLISPQSRGKRIEISRQFDTAVAKVWMDSEKVKQVILNLLANALDFTPQGGKIEIITKCQTGKDGHNSALIEVKDSGVGIPPSDINRVFDPYFTTKHKSNMHEGTGLGLFIAYQHVQDHRGTIEVRSKVNEGAAFLITLPLQPLS